MSGPAYNRKGVTPPSSLHSLLTPRPTYEKDARHTGSLTLLKDSLPFQLHTTIGTIISSYQSTFHYHTNQHDAINPETYRPSLP